MRSGDLQARLAKTTLSPQGWIQSQIEVLQQKEREIIQVMAQGEHCIKVSMVRKTQVWVSLSMSLKTEIVSLQNS